MGNILEDINYVNRLIKKFGSNIDRNVYYELVYAKKKFTTAWSDDLDSSIKESILGVLDSIDSLLSIIDLDEVQKREPVDIRSLDKYKYHDKLTVFNGNTRISNKVVTTKSMLCNYISRAWHCFVFLVLFAVLVFAMPLMVGSIFESNLFSKILSYIASGFSLVMTTIIGTGVFFDMMYMFNPVVRHKLECWGSDLVTDFAKESCGTIEVVSKQVNDIDRLERNTHILDMYYYQTGNTLPRTHSNSFKKIVESSVDAEFAIDKMLNNGEIKLLTTDISW